jgi:hypothetical protein
MLLGKKNSIKLLVKSCQIGPVITTARPRRCNKVVYYFKLHNFYTVKDCTSFVFLIYLSRFISSLNFENERLVHALKYTDSLGACCCCALQPEVLKRATVEAFAVRVPDELSSRDALVERGAAAAAAIRDDGPIKPRRPLHVRVEEARHRYPRRVLALVREDPVLHAPEPVVAHKLHAQHSTARGQGATTVGRSGG